MTDFPKWCLFFDFHTQPANPDVGKSFDFEAIVDNFEKAGVKFVIFPARCNLGTAYYYTEIGTRHPSLSCDLLKEFAAACHRRGILVSGYFNGGLSHDEALHHREWTVLRQDGKIHESEPLDSYFRQMCSLTGYGDHLEAMVKEAIVHCDLDGIFIDSMRTEACFGVECIEAMRKENVDITDYEQVWAFNRRKHRAFAKRLADAAKSVKEDAIIYFNGLGYETQAQIGTYLELECLPNGRWGYECLPFTCRYLRTLGKPVLNMTGRFHFDWGDFGGLRPEASLEYDCIYGIANGLRTTIGDHFHPRGDINRAVAEQDIRIYNRLQQLEEWIDGAKPVVEIAVVMQYPYPGYDMRTPKLEPVYTRNVDAVRGATRMLCELKQQFDVPSFGSSWENYDILILPDYCYFDDAFIKRIQAHLAKGGKIIASAWSGVLKDLSNYAFPEWGCRLVGKSAFDPVYFQPKEEFAGGFPDMPMNFYSAGVEIQNNNSTVLATVCKPYYSRHWDGEHGFVYCPPDQDTAQPAVICNEKVGYIANELFSGYYQTAAPHLRQITANLLERLLPHPILRTPDAPSYLRATVTEQARRRMVYLLAYLPEHRGANAHVIEERLTVDNQRVMLRLDGRAFARAYLAPTRETLPMTFEDGYAVVTVPKISGYCVVVFEE